MFQYPITPKLIKTIKYIITQYDSSIKCLSSACAAENSDILI